MKNLILLFCLSILFASCFSHDYSSSFNATKFHNKKIAVLPFEIHTTVGELPDGITMEMVDEVEREKGITFQRDLYRYLIRGYAKSNRKVSFQEMNITNKIFKDKGMDFQQVFATPKRELAKILKVDAVIYGNIYQSKQKLRLDSREEVKFSSANNSISSVIYVYGKRKGKIQWKDDRQQSGFPSTEAYDVIKGLLRKAAKNFPF